MIDAARLEHRNSRRDLALAASAPDHRPQFIDALARWRPIARDRLEGGKLSIGERQSVGTLQHREPSGPACNGAKARAKGSQIGHKESFKDTARVLGRMYDAIEYRGSAQKGVETLAKYAGVPVCKSSPTSTIRPR